MIRIKRVYEEPTPNDGVRILVDRMWPRGLTKQRARVDLWLKDVAPSNELRRWFAHDPARWAGFRRRYFDELSQQQELIGQILAQALDHTVTLLYAAKDTERNNAACLLEYLTG